MPSLLQDHYRMFALYNRWANGLIYDAAGALTPEQLAEDRGAFFKSVLGTLNHLVVTDRIWMARIEGAGPRDYRLDEILFTEFGPLRAARAEEDKRIVARIYALSDDRLLAPLSYRTSSGADYTQPLHQALAHVFNHQTHHRGQAHDLIGQILGADKTPPLDLLAYQRFAAASDTP